jgi:hypothetical protein
MKIKRGLKIAHSLLLNAAVLLGTIPFAAHASAAAEQIYSWPTILSKTASEKMIVTKGVTYQKFNFDTSSGPILLYETWADLSDPNVGVKAALSGNKLENEKNETVSEMARRTGAVAGMNGDFYEAEASAMALGMGVSDGKLIHSPTSAAVLGIGYDNSVVMGKYQLTAGLTAANGKSHGITAVNGHPVSYPNGMVLLTPELGFWEMAANATVLTLKAEGGQYNVQSIEPAKTVVEAPVAGYLRVLAQGADAINFVTANVKQGDLLNVSWGTSPSSTNLKYAIGGGPILMKDGEAYKDPNPPLPGSSSYRGPITGVGVTGDGKHLLLLAVDGRSSKSIGLTYAQVTNYFAARGIADGMLLDGGGSTDLVVRQPGDTTASVVNNPSDGWERRIANGLFLYSMSPTGTPAHIDLNDGNSVQVFKGRTVAVSAPLVRDQNYNPLPNTGLTFKVEPASLGSISQDGRSFTAGTAGGDGKIIATAANGATGEAAVKVFGSLDSMTIAPNVIDVGNGEAQSFTVKGSVQGQTFALSPQDLTWSVENGALGKIGADGVFTATTDNQHGQTKVTAKFGSASATATVNIGYVQHTLDTLTDGSKWTRTDRWGDVGTLTTATTDAQGGKTSFLSMNYKFASGTGLKQFIFYPKTTMSIPADNDPAAVNPVGIGLWVHGNNSGVKMTANFEMPDKSLAVSPSQVRVNWDGWRYVTFKAPTSAAFPLKLDFLSVFTEDPSENMTGTLYFSDLQALFAASTYKEKPPVTPPPTQSGTFADMTSHWGRDVVEGLADKGILNGRDATHFAPDAGLNRAEAVAMIVRALKLSSDKTASFSDVSADAWYAGSVGAAVKAGITNGVGNDKFAPTDDVNRNQIAKMIYTGLKQQGKTPNGGTPISFKDSDDIASWSQAEINALSAAGLMVGDGTGYLRPVKVTTRVEAAYLINNMLKYAGKL